MDTGKSSIFADGAAGRYRSLGLDRAAVPLVIGIFLLLAVGGVIAWLVTSSQKQSRLVFNAFEVQRTASRVFRIVLSAETGQRGFLLTGEEPYLSPYNTAREVWPSGRCRIW